MKGGEDLLQYEPARYDPESSEELLGCHRGDNEYLNIVNPQPEMHYYWERAKRGDRRVLRRLRESFEVVTDAHPESLPSLPGHPDLGLGNLDSTLEAAGVVLMRIPIHKYREKEAARAAAAARPMELAATGSTFTDRDRWGMTAGDGGPIYRRLRDHGITRTSHGRGVQFADPGE